MKAPIVLFVHAGRSGSTYLVDLLKENLNIGILGEVFNENVNYLDRLLNKRWYEVFDSASELVQWQYLKAIENDLWNQSPRSFYSVEYKPSLMPSTDLRYHVSILQQFKRLGIRHIVFLERRSVFRRILSRMLAEKTGVWHTRTDSASLTDPSQLSTAEYRETRSRSILFDPTSVRDPDILGGDCRETTLEQCQAHNDYFWSCLRDALAGDPWFVCEDIIYETDICAPPEIVINKIAALLNLSPTAMAGGSYSKMHSGDYIKYLQNGAEVAEYLSLHNIRT